MALLTPTLGDRPVGEYTFSLWESHTTSAVCLGPSEGREVSARLYDSRCPRPFDSFARNRHRILDQSDGRISSWPRSYKATLFMVAGSIDHETGMRDATLLRGLRGLMPITAIAGGLAALSMSGVPPFFGFIGKELIYKAGVSLGGIEQSLLGVAFVGNLLMMALALNAGVGPFFGSLIMKRCRGSPMKRRFRCGSVRLYWPLSVYCLVSFHSWSREPWSIPRSLRFREQRSRRLI